MKRPLNLTMRNIELTQDQKDRIHHQVRKLEQHYSRITGCNVMVEGPGEHHVHGGLYRIRIEIFIPGWDIVINHHNRENPSKALMESFQAARRRLENLSRRRQDRTRKNHRGSATRQI